MVQAIEIEIDGKHNEQLVFRPLQRSIRGKFDMNRLGEPNSRTKAAAEWPVPIPSQRIGINPDGTGYLIEPLYDAEHEAIKEKIERSGKRLEPALTEYENIHAPSWLFWIKRAVESGLARITKGKMPDKIDGTPRTNFILAEPLPTSSDKMTDALNAQAKAFDRLATAIEKLVTQ